MMSEPAGDDCVGVHEGRRIAPTAAHRLAGGIRKHQLRESRRASSPTPSQRAAGNLHQIPTKQIAVVALPRALG